MVGKNFVFIEKKICEKVNSIINNTANFNKDYVDLTLRMIELQNEILEFLPQDFKTLYYDLEILIGERDDIKNLNIYKKGFIDGIEKNLYIL